MMVQTRIHLLYKEIVLSMFVVFLDNLLVLFTESPLKISQVTLTDLSNIIPLFWLQ